MLGRVRIKCGSESWVRAFRIESATPTVRPDTPPPPPPPPPVVVSPEKALRAAMLKARFAETIVRAKHKNAALGPSLTARSIRAEKARIEREQREERARIEADVRAKCRERNRVELENMGKTVSPHIDGCNFWRLEADLLRLSGGSTVRLSQLGLFLRHDDDDDHLDREEDHLDLDLEEGEIL